VGCESHRSCRIAVAATRGTWPRRDSCAKLVALSSLRVADGSLAGSRSDSGGGSLQQLSLLPGSPFHGQFRALRLTSPTCGKSLTSALLQTGHGLCAALFCALASVLLSTHSLPLSLCLGSLCRHCRRRGGSCSRVCSNPKRQLLYKAQIGSFARLKGDALSVIGHLAHQSGIAVAVLEHASSLQAAGARSSGRASGSVLHTRRCRGLLQCVWCVLQRSPGRVVL